MAKIPAQKQKAYLERLSSRYKQRYLKTKLQKLKLEKEKYDVRLKKDRERKRRSKEANVKQFLIFCH